jgi:hypothetical protein
MHVNSGPIVITALVLLVAACDGRLNSLGPATANRDRTAPTVVSTTPANLATQVGTTSPISITFSEPMQAASISTSAVTFTPNIAGTLSYAGATAIFAPTAPLAASTLYTGTITTAAEDIAGNNLAAAFTWSFTTGGASLIPAAR